MSLVVVDIPVGSKLVDTISPLGPTQLRAFCDAGVQGIIAYLSHNLDSELVANATALGLGIVPVNVSRKERWVPSSDLGEQDASISIAALEALSIPVEGLVDWCDLERCGADPTTYLWAWGGQVAQQGRIAGCYVGAGGLLNAAQLYAMPKITRYWHSQSRGIPDVSCGFVMFQVYPQTTLAGVMVDYNIACRDFKGRTGTWVKSVA